MYVDIGTTGRPECIHVCVCTDVANQNKTIF